MFEKLLGTKNKFERKKDAFFCSDLSEFFIL